ncbi:YncE family protein [Piscinibacter sakaiensis]|uniref:YncE family protein n=1 Tax=Piscinibacter sakaiensis TaxID=1547922 RepID=UPI003AAEF52B
MRQFVSSRGLWVAALVLSLAACGGGGGGGAASSASNDIGARMSASSLVVERDTYQRGTGQPLQLKLLVDRLPGEGFFYRVTHTSNAIFGIGKTPLGDGSIDLQLQLQAPGVLGNGSHVDTVTVEVCLDQACLRPAAGSPFLVPVTLAVGFFAPTEAGVPSQPQTALQALSHDLVAAAYSRSQDTLLMVSRTPVAALHVVELATGRSRSMPLASAPTSVAVSPDGLHAAVGHDGAVSLVDLGTTASVRRIPVGTVVGSVVLDASARIHAFGAASTWTPVFVVDTATGSVEPSVARIFGPGFPVLHPAGTRIYSADRDISPSDIFRVSLGANGVSAVKDSPYHGEYEICGQVWAGTLGARLYTACGNIFGSTEDVGLDMRYIGSFALAPKSGPAPWGSIATSVSDSPVSDRLLVLEQDKFICDPRQDRQIDCFTRVATHAASTLALLSRNTLAPITVGADRFAQIGRYVFHRPDGRALLLSELRGAPAANSIRLSTLP